jgi:hypothetical protein
VTSEQYAERAIRGWITEAVCSLNKTADLDGFRLFVVDAIRDAVVSEHNRLVALMQESLAEFEKAAESEKRKGLEYNAYFAVADRIRQMIEDSTEPPEEVPT